jgi:hypothetical protein
MRCVPIDHDSPTWCFECGGDTFRDRRVLLLRDLPRAAGELEVVSPFHTELCPGLVQGEPHTVHSLLHRVGDERDLDPAEARLERNDPPERICKCGEQLTIPWVIGLEQVQDDQSGHGRIVRGGVMRAPPCLRPQPGGFEGLPARGVLVDLYQSPIGCEPEGSAELNIGRQPRPPFGAY